MTYKTELRGFLKEKQILEEKIQKLLRPIVFSCILPVYHIPKTKEDLSKLMKRVLNINKRQWLDLRIIDIVNKNHKNLFIFGREKFILGNLEEIAEMIKNGRHCKMGNVGITFSALIKFDMRNFI